MINLREIVRGCLSGILMICTPVGALGADASLPLNVTPGLGNYFLTEEARGGRSKKLLGEKKDVKVWLAWLERLVHNEVGVIKTPIGKLPKYNDLRNLFKSIIDKDYSEELFIK